MGDYVNNGARRTQNGALVIRGGATAEDRFEEGFLRGAPEGGKLGPIVVAGPEGAPIGGGGSTTSGESAPSLSLASGSSYTQVLKAREVDYFTFQSLIGWNLAGKGEGTPTIVNEAGKQAPGSKAVKFALSGTEVRSEITLGGGGGAAGFTGAGSTVYLGHTYKMTWFVYVPTGKMSYGGPGKHNTIWQLHPTGEEGPTLSLELGKYPTGEEKTGLYAAAEKAGVGSNYFLASFAEGVLHKLEIEFTAATGTTGSWFVWLDGVKVGEATNVKTLTANTANTGYVKLGIYSGSEGTRELYASGVEWITEAPGVDTSIEWIGQASGTPQRGVQSNAPARVETEGVQELEYTATSHVTAAVNISHGLGVLSEIDRKRVRVFLTVVGPNAVYAFASGVGAEVIENVRAGTALESPETGKKTVVHWRAVLS